MGREREKWREGGEKRRTGGRKGQRGRKTELSEGWRKRGGLLEGKGERDRRREERKRRRAAGEEDLKDGRKEGESDGWPDERI